MYAVVFDHVLFPPVNTLRRGVLRSENEQTWWGECPIHVHTHAVVRRIIKVDSGSHQVY